MSKGATLSVMGLYDADNTLFDMMSFPDGFTTEQKNIVKENILIESAELEVLYPNPYVMKTVIGVWSAKEKPYWDRVYRAALEEYNPIENYRRNETETITDDRNEKHSGSDIESSSGNDDVISTGKDTTTRTGTEATAKTGTETDAKTGTEATAASGSDGQSGSSTVTETHSQTDTVDNSITGYDSNTLVPHDQSTTTYGHKVVTGSSGSNTTTYGRTDTTTHNTTDTITHNTTDTLTLNTTETLDHDTTNSTVYNKKNTFSHGEEIKHEGSSSRSVLAYGNIGVTTSQEMLTAEMEVAKIIQVVPIIIESFINRFCLLVY